MAIPTPEQWQKIMDCHLKEMDTLMAVPLWMMGGSPFWKIKWDKEDRMKYEEIKPVHLMALKAIGGAEWPCSGALDKFVREFGAGVAPFSRLQEIAEDNPVWTDWLVEHGFWRVVVDEVTYKRGQLFSNESGQTYMLTQVSSGRYCQMATISGPDVGKVYSWNPVKMRDTGAITQEELDQFSDLCRFTLIDPAPTPEEPVKREPHYVGQILELNSESLCQLVAVGRDRVKLTGYKGGGIYGNILTVEDERNITAKEFSAMIWPDTTTSFTPIEG